MSARARRPATVARLRTPLLLALVAATTAAVVTSPFLVSVAEGCSGASQCRPTDFVVTLSGTADGMPTDGWLTLTLTPTKCNYGTWTPGGAATIEVTDAAGAKVAGAPSSVSLPPVGSAGPAVAEWFPAAPLAPGASYTVTVSGPEVTTWSLPFTTGASAMSTPVVSPPKVSVARHVKPATGNDWNAELACVMSFVGDCFPSQTKSAPTKLQPRVSVYPTPDVQLPALEKQFFTVTHEVAVDGGGYNAYDGAPLNVAKQVCVITVVRLQHSYAGGVRSDPTCQGVSQLDLSPVDNCCAAKRVIDECPSGGGKPSDGLAKTAIQAFERDCGKYTPGSTSCHGGLGTAGSSGGGGGGGGDGAGGGTSSAGGGTSSAGGGTSSGGGGPDDGGGCMISSPSSQRALGATAGLAALLACALVWRRRR